jgi:hypothetical protein
MADKKRLYNNLQVLENYINDVPMIINPCRSCENCINEIHNTKVCIDCCYFYDSQFKIKEENA